MDQLTQLTICMVYELCKGGSKFHISEGNKLQVKLNNGLVVIGVFNGCNSDGTVFMIEDSGGCSVTVECKDVIDIMPL